MSLISPLVFVLCLLQFCAPSFCPDNINDRELEVFLCRTGRWVLGFVPYGDIALKLLDKFFGKKVEKVTVWDKVKKQVESYVQEKLDTTGLANIRTWHNSMTSRLATCQAKINRQIKVSCFKNLQEDLSGYEPRYRGSNIKENSLYLKYYDIYVITFMSVSSVLKNLSDNTLRASIKRDVSLKAQIFANHYEDVLPKVEAYVCRHIRVKLEEIYLFWREHRIYWPEDEQIVPWLLNKNTTFKNVWTLLNQSLPTCGLFDITNEYEADIVDVIDDSKYPGGPWRGKYCKTKLAIGDIMPQVYDVWKIIMRICVESAENKWLNELWDRLKTLKTLYRKKV